ncbi:unnamed protein product [Ceutorhynchus assimilis]|uniref:Beta-1,4-N-acetylgalactosaminyltransferase n=1 Tax=Ceutorhynchus assimilis TaxID=467358 RepID=A0A9N9ME73_9CUCU|nr:unnamed protein product [Ceutorhynchus assimilis]
MLTTCIQLLCLTALFVAVYFPARHARHYEYVAQENVLKEIVLNNHPHFSNKPNCTYEDIVSSSHVIQVSDITKQQNYIAPLFGGEFIPKHCVPLIKTAIVVPYRNRTEQLNIFVNYMHKFLQQQQIHYKLIVVEQNDTLPFNRAKMINIGAQLAMDSNYTCLILHDVDLIPLTKGNLYGCSKRPRHMSSSLDTFRYNLPYLKLFGGAVAILSDQYENVNGMSNSFYGWGGEDDDFYNRLEAKNILPYRFAPEISKYTMLMHKKQPKNDRRFENLKWSLENIYNGLSKLSRKYSVRLENLYTKVIST